MKYRQINAGQGQLQYLVTQIFLFAMAACINDDDDDDDDDDDMTEQILYSNGKWSMCFGVINGSALR